MIISYMDPLAISCEASAIAAVSWSPMATMLAPFCRLLPQVTDAPTFEVGREGGCRCPITGRPKGARNCQRLPSQRLWGAGIITVDRQSARECLFSIKIDRHGSAGVRHYVMFGTDMADVEIIRPVNHSQ